jgi:putative CocE/NonD family hydrolase
VPTNNLFRMRALCASLIILFFAGALAFSAAPRRTLPQETKQSKRPAIDVDATTLDSYQGQYATDANPDVVYSFFHDGANFYVEGSRSPRLALAAQTKNSFAGGNPEIRFAFVTDSAGKVTGVSIGTGNNNRLATRISDRPVHNHFRPYARQEFMIPMRDGVKLFAVVLRPTDVSAPLPIIMERTPYGVADNDAENIGPQLPELSVSGYIFVFEDIRGRYKSEGKFVMMRPLADHKDAKQVDESTDAYDTVAWLIENIPNNNGRVGVMGTSYPGFLTAEAGIDPHPAVKAISPQAPMTDVWMGDDFFHNGAFRQSYGYDYALGMESGKENAFGKLDQDAYDYFLQAGSFAAAAKKSGLPMLPTWQAFLTHASYDNFWSGRAVQPHETRVEVPTLEVGGYWDQEDMWGPQAEYAALKPHDAKHEVFIVLGPWNHGQWASTTRRLGALDWGAPVGDQFRAQIEAPYFAHYLKDEGPLPIQDAASFQTGSNTWKHYSHWPPTEGVATQNLYLGENGALSFTAPTGNEQDVFAEYKSDPANPVPYRKRPIEATYAPTGSQWYTWLAQDQSFLADRKDIASWTTDVLDDDVTVTGDVIADIFASTTGTDSDWIVKLIDVYPSASVTSDPRFANTPGAQLSGYQLMIAEEIFRGRYHNSFEHPEALEPNKITEFKYSLHAADHVFLKGHKIMVQVQSSWFPLYDRNPQTFVPNIMTASPGDYQPATQRIFWMPKYPSHIELPVAH